MGSFISAASNSHPSIGVPTLKVQPPTSDMSEIPWATRSNELPTSEHSSAHHHGDMVSISHNSHMINVDQLMNGIEQNKIPKPYTIIYPTTENGVFTVSKGSNTGVTA